MCAACIANGAPYVVGALATLRLMGNRASALTRRQDTAGTLENLENLEMASHRFAMRPRGTPERTEGRATRETPERKG